MKSSNYVLGCSSQRINRCPTFNCNAMSALPDTIRVHYKNVLRLISEVVSGQVNDVKYKVRGFDEKHHCFKVTVWLPFYYDGKVCKVKCDCNVNQGISSPNYPFAHNPFNSYAVADYVLSEFCLPSIEYYVS